MESALYEIFTLVGFVSEISLVRCAHSFDFRYFTNSCENPIRTRFPWSNLYRSVKKVTRSPWLILHKILGNSDILGSMRNLGKAFLFWIGRYFLFLSEVGIVKPVKSTRDSGCLARDELLVISKGDHKLIYIFLYNTLFQNNVHIHVVIWKKETQRLPVTLYQGSPKK